MLQIRWIMLVLAGCLALVHVSAKPRAKVGHTAELPLRRAIIRELGDLHELGYAGDIKFVSGQADLNNDGRPELLVWVPTIGYGGTGGYPLLIFRRERRRLKLLSEIGPVWTPIVVLRTSRHGWRDIVMQVGGGGEEMRYVRFRHNGNRYSDKFSPISVARIRGRVLIGKDWRISAFGPLPAKE